MSDASRRTAVLLVHGQGDQAPMDDLMALAHSAWEADPDVADDKGPGQFVSAPIRGDAGDDLRRLTTRETQGLQVDFYQFYWAPLMQGNRIGDVFSWLLRLLRRDRAEIPAAIMLIRNAVRGAVYAIAATALMLAVLCALRYLSPLFGYGMVITNLYSVIWTVVAAGVLVLWFRGKRVIDKLFQASVTVIAVAVIFAFAGQVLLPTGHRLLRDPVIARPFYFSVDPKVAWGPKSLIASVVCGIDSNPDDSWVRNYCQYGRYGEKAPDPPSYINRSVPPWHLVTALHRFLAGMVLALGVAFWLLLRTTVAGFLRDVMADSARYFSNDPRNVAQRDQIRRAGAEMIARLHADGRYDRIVVVAHSLGTVVAYGMLDHYWGQINGQLKGDGLDAVKARADALDREGGRKALAAYRKAQRQYSAAMATRDTPDLKPAWLVSDLITLGSPLTYGRFLLCDSNHEFESRTRTYFRLPTAPPQSDADGAAYKGGWIGAAAGTNDAPWHSAMFAAVRWTNIYFSNNGLQQGDIVGGPVAPAFGPGVLDIRVEREAVGPGFLHNDYWVLRDGHPSPHIDRLRQAMNLFEASHREAELLA